jgi:hypothetical protein
MTIYKVRKMTDNTGEELDKYIVLTYDGNWALTTEHKIKVNLPNKEYRVPPPDLNSLFNRMNDDEEINVSIDDHKDTLRDGYPDNIIINGIYYCIDDICNLDNYEITNDSCDKCDEDDCSDYLDNICENCKDDKDTAIKIYNIFTYYLF